MIFPEMVGSSSPYPYFKSGRVNFAVEKERLEEVKVVKRNIFRVVNRAQKSREWKKSL